MPLQARVGRHANTGDHCQNYVSDQNKVSLLLNIIPHSDGGAGGTLTSPMKNGVASNELYQAILRFQKKHFPAQQTGFIEPVGPQLSLMETLSLRMSALPPTDRHKDTGQWGSIKSKSVYKAIGKAVNEDGNFSHADIVDIIRSTISDGVLTAIERDDLLTIANTARALLPKSKALLSFFADELEWRILAGRGTYPLNLDDTTADRICNFLKRSSGSYFSGLDRNKVGVGLLLRAADPGLLNQGEANVCGPAVLLYSIAYSSPIQYVQFAIDLFEKGRAMLRRLVIEPGKDVRAYRPNGAVHQVDWLTMASIRDSENWFFDYDTVSEGPFGILQASGMTLPGELAHWFRKAGFSDIHEETNLGAVGAGALGGYVAGGAGAVALGAADPWAAGTGTLASANELFNKGYRVAMLINAKMLDKDDQSSRSYVPNHWVILRSPIDRSGGNVTLQVFTWGRGNYVIPQGSDLSVEDFLKNYYGYVAAKP